MDDIQLILYIIFAVIAILSQVFKAKKKNGQAPSQSNTSQQPPSRKEQPKSFEDLLKEFTGEQTKTVESRPSWEETKYETYEDDYEEEYQNDDEIRQTYNRSVKEAKELKTIDELVDLKDDRHTGNFTHFAGYEEEGEEVRNEWQELLSSPEGAKKAIILSEIINRKY